MDTTAIKSQIKAGEAQPKHDQSGMTKLLVTIPVDLRTGLAELSAESGVSQREIIRQAIRRLWGDGPSAIQANSRTGTVKAAKTEETTVKAKAVKTVHQVTPTVSIVKTDSELLHADLPAAKPTKTESRPPPPSPDHAWVVRGTGGYWRARKGSSK